jgi:hypothetical protein
MISKAIDTTDPPGRYGNRKVAALLQFRAGDLAAVAAM